MPLQVAEDDSTDGLDSDIDVSSVKESLDQFLSGVETFGSFATSGRVPGDVSTGLSVHNVGRIAFPLVEGQAKQVIEVCHQAPYGKGSETIVDESVRKTWELNPNQFDLGGPSWQSSVSEVTKKVARELGCVPETSVEANLYKLLLYEKGALFKPHKDTEKEPGMFGTLVICLPSEYTGGAVVTSHCGQSRSLEAESPSFFHSYISWYADVTHEVKPITSGYRIVLVYNLVNTSTGPAPSPGLTLQSKREIGAILRSWDKATKEGDSEAPEILVYQLDHQYTNGNMNLAALKGLDKVKADYLRETCPEANVCLYLASMEYSKIGEVEESCGGYCGRDYDDDDEDGSGGGPGNHHTIEEVLEENISLQRMVDLGGQLLALHLALDQDAIIQDDPFDRDPDKEDYEGYTGNAGASATHWYRDTVMVLIPLPHRSTYLGNSIRQGLVNVDAWIRRLIQVVSHDQTDHFAREDLRELSRSIISNPIQAKGLKGSFSYERKDLFQAPKLYLPIQVSVHLMDRRLFTEILVNLSCIELNIFPRIGMAIYSLRIEPEYLAINRLIDRLEPFHDRFQAIKYVKGGFDRLVRAQHPDDARRQKEVRVWASLKSQDALKSMRSVVRDDGACLAELAHQEPDIVPLRGCQIIAEQHTSNTAFLVALAVHILKAGKEGKIDAVEADKSFSDLLKIVVPNFTVECRTSSKRAASGSVKTSDTAQCLMVGNDVFLLLHQLFTKGLTTELLLITQKLSSEASRCEIVAFETFYFPLLSELTPIIAKSPIVLDVYRPLFHHILSSYIQRYVQVEPPKGNLTRMIRGCHLSYCSNCAALDAFLIDPKRKTKDFPVSSSERAHLHQRLNGTGIRHDTDRSRRDTLVVTKDLGSAGVKYEEWRKRFLAASEKVRGLDQTVLREVLGGEYDSITQLRVASKAEIGWQGHWLNQSRRAARPEVIDLT